MPQDNDCIRPEHDSKTKANALVQIGNNLRLDAWLLHASTDGEQTALSSSLNAHQQLTLILLHGSGATTNGLSTYDQLLPLLKSLHLRILLYNRRGHGRSDGSHTQTPLSAADDLILLLERLSLEPPYIVVAHSSGGAVAKAFLYKRPQDIAGMVLAETGQETALDSSIESRLFRGRGILGRKPLSVLRGNSFLAKIREIEADVTAGADLAEIRRKRDLLARWDAADEKAKKEQLKLSRRVRYVHISDAGHGIVRERPDIVAEEIHWVLRRLDDDEKQSTRQKLVATMRSLVWTDLETVVQDEN